MWMSEAVINDLFEYQIEIWKTDIDTYVLWLQVAIKGGYSTDHQDDIHNQIYLLNIQLWETIVSNEDEVVQSETTNDIKSI